jgi:hypothetical protein
MNFIDLLRTIDAIFDKCQAAYAIIGGYAVAAWGEERATHDIDFLCLSNSQKIVALLREEHVKFEHRFGDWDDPISEVVRIDCDDKDSPFEADILIGIKGAPTGLFDRVRGLVIENMTIPVASPEDMIILKLLAGSNRDIDDARSILKIQDVKLDANLLRKICPKMHQDALKKLLADIR